MQLTPPRSPGWGFDRTYKQRRRKYFAALTAIGGTKITTVSKGPTTLADGKTKATFTKRTWEIGGYPIITLTLRVEKGDKTIAYNYSNIDGMMNEKAGKEVLYTLTFTK